jgi:hypothetical protein
MGLNGVRTQPSRLHRHNAYRSMSCLFLPNLDQVALVTPEIR